MIVLKRGCLQFSRGSADQLGTTKTESARVGPSNLAELHRCLQGTFINAAGVAPHAPWRGALLIVVLYGIPAPLTACAVIRFSAVPAHRPKFPVKATIIGPEDRHLVMKGGARPLSKISNRLP